MMKKGLLFGFVGVMMLSAGFWFSRAELVSKEYYQPREAENSYDGPEGYISYLNMIRANPATGRVDINDVMRDREEVAELAARTGKKSALGLDWEIVGPTNIAGRSRQMIIDVNDPNTFYVGGVVGGLFKSTNAGASWVRKSDPLSNHAVSCIAQAADGTLYYGTGEDHFAPVDGEGHNTSPGFIGGGIYKSTDGGETWSVLTSTVPSPNTTGGVFSAISRIKIHPTSGDLYVGSYQGLRVSSDGGQTWTNPLTGQIGSALPVEDVNIASSGEVWIKVDRYVYKSDANGGNFAQVSGGSLPLNGGRSSIAISPSDPDYVYVVHTQNGSFNKAYQTTDGGSTWREIGAFSIRLNPHGTVGEWANTAEVDPANKERLLVAGLDLWEWSEQFGWQQLSLWSLPNTSAIYVHADIHDIQFSRSNPNTFYVISDGGVTRTQNNGITFQEINKNFYSTTFYDFAIGPDGRAFGGTQDQGTILVDPTASQPTDGVINTYANWGGALSSRVTGGDGSSTSMSKLVPGLITGAGNRFLYRFLDYGVTSTPDVINERRMDPANYYRQGGSGALNPEWSIWMPPVELWEKLNDKKSWDSIRYGADTINLSLGFGNGLTSFRGTFRQFLDFEVLKEENGQLVPDSSIFEPGGVTITAGSQSLISDANGNFTGNGSGTFDATTGKFQITFNKPVAVEIFGKALTRLEPGMIIRTNSLTGEFKLYDTVSTTLTAGQSAKVQDPVQTMFFVGLTSHLVNPIGGNYTRNHFGGVWMTRNLVSEPEKNPDWVHIGNLSDNESVSAMAVTNDGDILYVGTAQGRVYRFSNLSNARDSASADIDSLYKSNTFQRASTSVIEKTSIGIAANGRPILSLSVHPNDNGRLMATVGNYGFNTYVYFNDDADAPNAPAFTPVQGDLPAMPVYASTFNFTGSPSEGVIGTEMGIFTTDDIEAPNVSWVQEINDFAQVPVFDLQQDLTVRYDLKDENDFEGSIYAASHGLGIWKTTSTANFVTIGQEEFEADEEPEVISLNIFPNPASQIVNVDIDLTSPTDVELFVLDLNGKIVKQVKFNRLLPITKSVELRVGSLPRGAYVINLVAGKIVKTGKFIKE